jgi:2-polyprenyl-3-methyl-5-hydroxy-6-metoxy-1,4-benzoquinol methylase
MNDLKFESEYWGDCTNTFDEDQKHYIYAKYMGLQKEHYSFNVFGQRILDIGGGPTSILLKAKNLKEGLVCDPLHYPHWTILRYLEKNINVKTIRGEDVDEDGWDEVWIYNCLQHTDDPAKIISNALKAAKVLRIFEWVDIPPHEGHPQMITKEFLDECLKIQGNTVQLAENGCFGKAYYNIVT